MIDARSERAKIRSGQHKTQKIVDANQTGDKMVRAVANTERTHCMRELEEPTDGLKLKTARRLRKKATCVENRPQAIHHSNLESSKENMKRILTIWTIVLAALTFSTQASAEGGYFGVRGDAFIPISVNGYSGLIVLPLFGIQAGYDFGDLTEPGFGVRGSFRTLVILNELSINALYRIPDATGAGLYFGAGGDVVFLGGFGINGFAVFGAHALAGYKFPLSNVVSAFVEAVPGGLFGSGLSAFYISLASGINFHF
jgi:hypothetical protein